MIPLIYAGMFVALLIVLVFVVRWNVHRDQQSASIMAEFTMWNREQCKLAEAEHELHPERPLRMPANPDHNMRCDRRCYHYTAVHGEPNPKRQRLDYDRIGELEMEIFGDVWVGTS